MPMVLTKSIGSPNMVLLRASRAGIEDRNYNRAFRASGRGMSWRDDVFGRKVMSRGAAGFQNGSSPRRLSDHLGRKT